jgi:hypothetical protein
MEEVGYRLSLAMASQAASTSSLTVKLKSGILHAQFNWKCSPTDRRRITQQGEYEIGCSLHADWQQSGKTGYNGIQG